jgi:hypothetical protein
MQAQEAPKRNHAAGSASNAELGALLSSTEAGNKLQAINDFVAWIRVAGKDKPGWYCMILAQVATAEVAEIGTKDQLRRITDESLGYERQTAA